MTNKNNEIAPYLEESILNNLYDIYNKCELNTNDIKLETFNWLKAIENLIEQSMVEAMQERHIKALDAFGKPFVLKGGMYAYVKHYMNQLIQLKLENPDITLEDLMIKSGIRFSVEYLDTIDKKHAPAHILNIPADVYKFLIENNYDDEIKNSLHYSHFNITCNYIDIFRKVMKVGINFSDKYRVLDKEDLESDNGVVTYVAHKFNVKTARLCSGYEREFGHDKYLVLVNDCEKLDIHLITVIHRILIQHMSYSEALEIGIAEKDKYNIRYYTSEKSSEVREAFIKVIREYIKEQK